jgi:uncharacterized membrane protein YgcG
LQPENELIAQASIVIAEPAPNKVGYYRLKARGSLPFPEWDINFIARHSRHLLYFANICYERIFLSRKMPRTERHKENKMNIYVGNLADDVNDQDLREVFEAFGQVESVNIIKDKFSGESKGFGFIEMPSKDEAQAAIKDADSTDLKGKTITVNEARPRPSSGPRRSGGSRGGGFGGGRGGRGGGGRGGGGRGGDRGGRGRY